MQNMMKKIGISLADNQYYHERKYDRARVRIDLFQESRDSLINGPIKYLLITAVSHLIRATEARLADKSMGKDPKRIKSIDIISNGIFDDAF